MKSYRYIFVALLLVALSLLPRLSAQSLLPAAATSTAGASSFAHSPVIEEISPQTLAQLAAMRRSYLQQQQSQPDPARASEGKTPVSQLPAPQFSANFSDPAPPAATRAPDPVNSITTFNEDAHAKLIASLQEPIVLEPEYVRIAHANYIAASEPESVRFPYTTREKFNLFVRDSYDPYNFMGEMMSALYNQAQDDTYKFGGGAQGYGKRLGAVVATDVTSELFGTFIFSSAFHTDPRYFRMVHGSVGRRAAYAVTRILIVRKDSGGNTFNTANWLGGFATTAISNLYYPDRRRGAEPVFERTAVNIGYDGIYALFREFWPDVAHRLHIPAFVIRRTADPVFPDQQQPQAVPQPTPKAP